LILKIGTSQNDVVMAPMQKVMLVFTVILKSTIKIYLAFFCAPTMAASNMVAPITMAAPTVAAPTMAARTNSGCTDYGCIHCGSTDNGSTPAAMGQVIFQMWQE